MTRRRGPAQARLTTRPHSRQCLASGRGTEVTREALPRLTTASRVSRLPRSLRLGWRLVRRTRATWRLSGDTQGPVSPCIRVSRW